MYDTHDVRKSKELHDKEMLIDEMQTRIEALERRMNAHIHAHSVARGEY